MCTGTKFYPTLTSRACLCDSQPNCFSALQDRSRIYVYYTRKRTNVHLDAYVYSWRNCARGVTAMHNKLKHFDELIKTRGELTLFFPLSLPSFFLFFFFPKGLLHGGCSNENISLWHALVFRRAANETFCNSINKAYVFGIARNNNCTNQQSFSLQNAIQ